MIAEYIDRKISKAWATIWPWIVSLLFIILLGVTGCSGFNVQDIQQQVLPGERLWKCFIIAGGPPVGGKLVLVVLPENVIGPTFGDGCSIQSPLNVNINR